MKRRIKMVICIMCAALTLTACTNKKTSDKDNVVLGQGKKESEYQTRLNMVQPQAYSSVDGLKLEKGSYISIIGKASGTEYWDEVKKGAEDAVDALNDALGYKGKDQIKVTYNAPGDGSDVDEQVNILDEELDRYPAAVGIAVIDKEACAVQFDLAAENNIPIVEFDSKSDYQGAMSVVSTSNVEAGQTAADKMAGLLGEQGEVLLFIEDKKAASSNEREQGMVQQFQKQYPQIKVDGIYYVNELDAEKKEIVQKTNEGKKEGETITAEDITDAKAMEEILKKYPNAKGCIAASQSATEKVMEACEATGRTEMQIIGFDGGETQEKALKEGKLQGLIVQNPYGMGYATVVAAARSALDMGNEAKVDTGYAWVTKENMKEDAIKNMLY
nr:substrate-binding domain-containing protein [uncultured Sellimonas sp.]